MHDDIDPYVTPPATIPADPMARWKPGSRRLVKVRNRSGKWIRRPLTPRPPSERTPVKVSVDWRGNLLVSRS